MNAKAELLYQLEKHNLTVKDIAYIRINLFKYEGYVDKINKENIDIEDLNVLDFNYDDEYGGQNLYGFVLFANGSWLERHEYDGFEWWEYKKAPLKENIAKFDFSKYSNVDFLYKPVGDK